MTRCLFPTMPRRTISLLRANQPLAEELFLRGDVKRAPEQHLFGALDKVLTEQRLTPKDINLIVIGVGPGSFTGIRVGIAAARGLALPWQVPIKGVGSFDALALTALPRMPRDCPQMCVLCDARRDEIYSALYDVHGRRVRDCKISPLEAIADEIHNPIWFVSSEIERYAGELKDIFGGFASVCGEPIHPSAAALGWLGYTQFIKDGKRGDTLLEPMYLRETNYKKL